MFGFKKKNKNETGFSSIKHGKIEYLIVGLGNPGPKYAQTRHNAGFEAIDMLAKENYFEIKKLKFKALVADEMIGGKRCLLMKPQTMMNLSGEAVYEAATYYDIPDENIIVMYDDISLDVGKIRIRRKGSAGGHNGIKNIISCLGTEEFPRVKIGVGKKPSADYDLVKWVLGNVPNELRPDYNKALSNAKDAVVEIIKSDVDSAMNKFNS